MYNIEAMQEKFGKLESTNELTLGDLVKLKSDLSESLREILTGHIEENQTYKLHYIDVSEEDEILMGLIGPVDLEFNPGKYGQPENSAIERKLKSVGLKYLTRVTN